MTTNNQRVYVALTPQSLQQEVLNSDFCVVVDEAFASSLGFSEGIPQGEDLEVLEDAALYQAARQSLELQHGQSKARRVVAVAELPAGFEPRENAAAGDYRLTRPVQFTEVVAFHVDEAELSKEFPDLLWFDSSELDLVRDFLSQD